MKRIISPSMLSADFGNLARDTRMIDESAAEWVHIDVMDGRFVPNISFGFPVLKSIVAAPEKFMDVHLMIVEPETYLERFVKAGADLVVFHVEATEKVEECIRIIHEAGAKAGISIKPGTPVEAIREWLPMVDLVLVMGVEPGFGGQKFIVGSTDKVRQLKALREELGADYLIELDGGVCRDNAEMLFEAGCDVLVAGSAVFGAADPKAEILALLGE